MTRENNSKPSAHPPAWCNLLCTGDDRRASAVVTTIAAMEFEVRCIDSSGQVLDGQTESTIGPVTVQVRPDDHPVLLDVLDEIIAEQDEFDALLAARSRSLRTRRGMLLLAMIIIVAVLATLGLVQV